MLGWESISTGYCRVSVADLFGAIGRDRLGFGVGEGKGGQSASALEKSAAAGGRSGLG